jgi:hypothetical protein
MDKVQIAAFTDYILFQPRFSLLLLIPANVPSQPLLPSLFVDCNIVVTATSYTFCLYHCFSSVRLLPNYMLLRNLNKISATEEVQTWGFALEADENSEE